MYTCEYIEHGLVFGYRKLYVCCVQHSGTYGWIPVCDYFGGTLPLDAIIDKKKKLRVENIADGDVSCRTCYLFRKKESLSDFQQFKLLNFSHYSFCNLRCDYCYLTADEKKGGKLATIKDDYDIFPVLVDMFNRSLVSQNCDVFWGGGEPLLLNKFDDILNLLLSRNCMVHLNSNSTFFSEAVFSHLKNPNLELVTAVDAGTPELYFHTKKRNLFHKVWDNLGRYSSTGGNVSVKYIITDNNCSEEQAKSFADLVKKHQIKSVVIDLDNNIRYPEKKHRDMFILLKIYLKDKKIHESKGLFSSPEKSKTFSLKVIG